MRKRIGEFLTEKGVLSEAEVGEILEYGRRMGLRFGEAGLALGLLSEKKLIEVFGRNYRTDFFHLQPEYFPEKTQELLSTETVVEAGALPLGFKTEYKWLRRKKILNVGMVDPSRADAKARVENEARARAGIHGFDGFKYFLVLPGQLIEILDQKYGVSLQELGERDEGQIDPALAAEVEEEGGHARS